MNQQTETWRQFGSNYYHRKQRKYWSVLSLNHRTLMLLSLLTAWEKCLTNLQPMKLKLFCWVTLTSIISLQTQRQWGVTKQSNEVTSNEVTENRVTGKNFEGSKILKSF